MPDITIHLHNLLVSAHTNSGFVTVPLNETTNPTSSVQFAQQQALQFAIENRTTDPASAVPGQLWLRTDL